MEQMLNTVVQPLVDTVLVDDGLALGHAGVVDQDVGMAERVLDPLYSPVTEPDFGYPSE